VQLSKLIRLTESMSLDMRMEAFYVFNHVQFYGPASVDGVNPNFGNVVSAAPQAGSVGGKVPLLDVRFDRRDHCGPPS
jgi:hypothetical protein